MYESGEWFCEQVGRIVGAGNVVNIDEAAVDRVPDKVCVDVDVFHP